MMLRVTPNERPDKVHRVVARKLSAGLALIEQSRSLHAWLSTLPESDFQAPDVLPGWNVSTLVGHLIVIHQGTVKTVTAASASRPTPLGDYVRAIPPAAGEISAAAIDQATSKTDAEQVALFAAATDAVEARLAASADLPATLQGPRGPISFVDFIHLRIVDLVVHADDLIRAFPDRQPIALNKTALGICCRTLAQILAGQHPGRTLEVRVPPHAAVQCGYAGPGGIAEPGPTHTRGTPPNVVETDPVAFLRLATGRWTWAEGVDSARVSASGLRADLTYMLPVLS